MKKRTRLLSALLTLCMLLSLVPALGITAAAMDGFTLYVEVGDNIFDTPELKAAISEMTNGKATGLGIYDEYREQINFGVYETNYRYVIAYSTDEDIVTDKGLAKSPGEAVITVINMHDSRGPGPWYSLDVTVRVTGDPIDDVHITGLKTPTVGAKLSDGYYGNSKYTGVTCTTKGVQNDTIDVYWWVLDNGKLRLCEPDETFETKLYYADVAMEPELCYEFCAAGDMSADMDGTPCDMVHTVESDIEWRLFRFGYDLTDARPEILGLDEPTHGMAADYTAYTPSETCAVTKIQYTMFNKVLDPYVGVNGDNLGIKVTVENSSAYPFPEGAIATWNGIQSISATLEGRNTCTFLFPYTVGVDEDDIIRALSMTVEAPAVGKAPAATATVDWGVRIESLTWEPADATFKEGVSYTVTGYLWPKDAYVFDSGIVENQLGTVNGNQAVLTKPTSGGIKDQFMTGIYVSYTFPELKSGAPVITAQPKDVDAKPGDTVTFTVTATGDDLHYRWYLEAIGSAEKIGTDSPTLTIKNVTIRDYNDCDFYCVVSNKSGEVISDKARLTVSETPYKFPFTDVPESAWYYESIRDANKMGLINGTTATTYAPKNNMTVAEAIKLAACMHQLYHDGEVTLANAEGKWYISYYDYCRDNGIISATGTAQEPSYDDYVARAKENITRREYVFLFSRALPDSALPAVNTIPDNSIPDVPMSMSVYDQAIYKLYRAGILNGADAKGTFMPDSSIRRSEVAAILIRMMEPSARVGAPSELGK